jgi:hypothetical protein
MGDIHRFPQPESMPLVVQSCSEVVPFAKRGSRGRQVTSQRVAEIDVLP